MTLQSELDEAREQVAMAKRKKTRLLKENLALENQLLGQQKEAETLWTRKKKEFIKSEEFEVLFSGKALELFELVFKGYVAKLQANKFSDAEYPYSFMSLKKSLDEIPNVGDMVEEESKKKPSLTIPDSFLFFKIFFLEL